MTDLAVTAALVYVLGLATAGAALGLALVRWAERSPRVHRRARQIHGPSGITPKS